MRIPLGSSVPFFPALVLAAGLLPAGASRADRRARLSRPSCSTPSRGCRTKSRSRCASTRARSCWWSIPPASAASRPSTRGWRRCTASTGRAGWWCWASRRTISPRRPAATRRSPTSAKTPSASSFRCSRNQRCAGADANPLFKQLAQPSGTTPKWNFYKYLIGRDGKVVDTYSSMTAPDDRALRAGDREAAWAQRRWRRRPRNLQQARTSHKRLRIAREPARRSRAHTVSGHESPDRFSCCEVFRAHAARLKSRGDSSPPPSLPPSRRGAS